MVFPFISKAQTDTFYYDLKWKNCKKSAASYYRSAIKIPGNKYKVEDHYISGSLQMSGFVDSLPDAQDKNTGHFVYYDSMGHKTAEGEYINNLHEGLWTYYYRGSDKMKSRVNFLKDNRNGHAAYYDSSTSLINNEGEWRNDTAIGVWKYYYSGTQNVKFELDMRSMIDNYYTFYDSITHKKISEGATFNYLRNDDWKFYDSATGTLLKQAHYKYGKLDGKMLTYDITGKPATEEVYVMGYLNGVSKMYYKGTGALNWEMGFKNSVPNGIVVYYDSLSHRKKSDGEYDNGERSGVWHFYNDNDGSLRTIEYYKQGNGHDVLIGYDAEKHKMYEGKYKRGICSGNWVYYFKNGNVSAEMTLKNNLLNGNCVYYDTVTNKKIYEGEYKNGEKSGEWTTYFPNGNVKSVQTFKEGEMNGRFELYDSSGYKISEGDFVDGNKNGQWKYYYASSKKVWIKANFKNDMADGKLLSYYKDGQLKRDEFYSNGEKLSGDCFNEKGEKTDYYPFIVKAYNKGDIGTYISKNLVYPEKAKEAKIEGKVMIGFNINADGTLSDISVLKGIGGGCDEEAKRLVAEMPGWVPMQLDGKYFQTYYTLPVVFWLQD
jgi:TonB family protein